MTAANATVESGDDAPHFFVSRTGSDAAIAIEVRDTLVEAGYRVLIQDKDFPNKNFMDQMDRGLASGAQVIALISEDYFLSDHCQAEWMHPLTDDPLNRKARLIVLKARECVPRGLLKGIAHWDLVKVRDTPSLRKAMVLAAVDPAHRTAPLLSLHWRKPEVIRHPQVRETPGFTGREAELAAITRALWIDHTTPALSAAVQGFGGVGKTTVAREYAWRSAQFDHFYDGIWWLDAQTQYTGETPSWPGIQQGYIELGDLFIRGLAKQPDPRAAALTACEFVGKGGFAQPWLIVYDNVDDVRTLTHWPPPRGAHVIVTSRLATKAKGVSPVEIGIWPLSDAKTYLRENSGRPDLTDAEAEAIAQALGCLPLAVAHAAAFLADNDNATVADYLKSVDTWMQKVPESAKALASPDAVPLPVYATLQQNIAQAEARGPGAAAVLTLAAFYAPDAIPEELFRQAADHYPPALARLTGDGTGLVEAIGALGRLRLISIDREASAFSVHRLVQAAARNAAGPERKTWAAAAVTAAEAAFPVPDFTNWPLCERLLAHARSAIGEGSDDIGLPLASLTNKAGHYLHDRAAYDLAEPLTKRSLDIREKALGPDHPLVGTSLNDLAALYHSQAKYDLAEPLYKRALDIREKALGPEHPAVGTSLHNLAGLYFAQAKYELAEPLYKRDLAINEKALGPNHPAFGGSLNNLAGLYEAQGHYDLAEPLYKRTLSIFEKALGPDHPDVGTALNNLARLYEAQGHYDLAEPLFKRDLAISEKSLGPDHPDVGASLNNLANLYRAQGKYDLAEPLFKRDLAISEKALGPDHPDVGTSLNNLAGLYRVTERLDEAETLATRAVGILEARLGAGHPHTVAATSVLDAITTARARR